MTIEAILLIPTYYRKEQALLRQCEEISAAAAKAIPLLSLQGASGEIAIKGKGKMHTYWLRGKTAKQPSPKTAAVDNPAQSQLPAVVPLLES